MGEMGSYRLFGLGDARLGGMMTMPKGSKMPSAWSYYIQVANIEDAIARATKRGAKIMIGPMEVPGGARVAQLLDPQGAAFALHRQAAT
jgi:hypothetical protein